MAQADYVISANPTGLAMRTEVNQIFQAILTNNSGSVAPTTTQAGMFWGDISNASTYYLKIRNHTNDGWVSLYAYDVATKTIQAMANGSTLTSLLALKANLASPTFTGTVVLPATTSIGNVSNTEIGYLDGATSAIQTQLDAKVAKVTSTDNAIARYDGTGGAIQNSSVYIDDSGNLGIGTSSPNDIIHIAASSSDEKGISVSNSYTGGSTGTHYYLNSYDGTSTTLAGGILATNDTWSYHGYGAKTTNFIGSHSGGTNIMATAASGIIKFFTGGDNTSNERMRIDSSGNLQFNSGYGSVATAYACRAWVNFNGTGTVAIRASGNVSSITDNGTGDYTLNFTTAMVDANYSFNGTVRSESDGATYTLIASPRLSPSKSVNSFRIMSMRYTMETVDTPEFNIAVFR